MGTEDFPARVRAERKSRKMTQQQLADSAGVALRTVQMFESGKAQLQPANLRAVLGVLGIDPDGNQVADDTRAGWPGDIQVFLDVMGAYLSSMPEAERMAVIQGMTRQIFGARDR